MSQWSDRRARSLLDDVTRFLDGLEKHQRLRMRLQARGYTEQVHRGLQACLARATALAGQEGTRPLGRVAPGPGRPGQAWAVMGWVMEEMRLASLAARKVPTVVRAIRRLAHEAGEKPPLELIRATGKLARRVGDDEHLGHFLTLGGLRDASTELRHRLHEGGSATARAARQQTLAELGFLFARWKTLTQEELMGEPSALRSLGLEP